MFRPSIQTPKDTIVTKVSKAQFNGFVEFRVELNITWAELLVRKSDDHDGEIEVEWIVGPIDGNVVT